MLRQIREAYRGELAGIYDASEADALFYWAAQEILSQPRPQIIAALNEAVSEAQNQQFASVLCRLKNQEPIQYIFGKAYFLDLVLRVTPDVLIPRGETEELVLWALESLSEIKNPVVLDLCTGSGAIALAMAKARPDAEVWACDISEPALAVARQNNAECGTSVRFFRQDILQEPLPYEVRQKSFHLIISNPPYVRLSEKTQMRANVLQYEPHSALFVPEDDPLRFYRRIAAIARDRLRAGGRVLVEINEAFPEKCKNMFEQYGLENLEVRSDIHSRPRMLRAEKSR